MVSEICFIDCETTGLDPERHVPWEIGLIVGDETCEWIIELSIKEMSRADPQALRLTHYYERVATEEGPPPRWIWGSNHGTVSHPGREPFARWLAGFIGTRHLAGNVVSFDARMIGDFLKRNGAPPIWHYHLIDVENIAAGRLGLTPPWKSEDLSRALGVDPDQYERHTALGDARWAAAMYEAAMAK